VAQLGSKQMRTFSLSEVVRAGRVAQNVSDDGAVLRYSPDQQVLGRGAIIEVRWPDDTRGGPFGLVEVMPDEWGELVAQPANVPNDSVSIDETFRLPLVPVVGWSHEQGCDCGACAD
jgi:hypothetical protein